MKPWTKEDYDKFKALVCSENICTDCNNCNRSEKDILDCFADLTSELLEDDHHPEIEPDYNRSHVTPL